MKLYYPTKVYRTCGFRVGSHAISRMRSRGVTKSALRYNLSHKPIHVSKIVYNKNGQPSYKRFSKNKVVTAINPNTKNINSVWPFHTRLLNKYMKGKK